MKEIRVKFCDFWESFNPLENDFYNILRKKYNVILSDEPDYIFYSTFGYDYLNYSCIRIFYTGECITPDFNECDYAIGFDYIEFSDRYIRCPLYMLFEYKYEYLLAIENEKKRLGTNLSGKKFCSVVCSNDNDFTGRKEIIEAISQYKIVDSGGRYLNNVGGPIKDKLDFQSKYKFSIAFENCFGDGYTTEKIVQSFAAGTIPIYYGNPKIHKEFNTKRFVNCHDYCSFEEVVRRIEKIDSDDKLYLSMINEPIQIKETIVDIENFLYNIFDQDVSTVFRRTKNSLAEIRLKDKIVISKLNKYLFKRMRKIKNLFRRIQNKSLI